VDDFQKELAALLKKHSVALVCKSNKNKNDLSVEIGFQGDSIDCVWSGRHHLTDYEIQFISK
tara:strand:+ start:5114 stop:5299 length:186 start_codon:yes stop_codon:yes gene_type:complete